MMGCRVAINPSYSAKLISRRALAPGIETILLFRLPPLDEDYASAITSSCVSVGLVPLNAEGVPHRSPGFPPQADTLGGLMWSVDYAESVRHDV